MGCMNALATDIDSISNSSSKGVIHLYQSEWRGLFPIGNKDRTRHSAQTDREMLDCVTENLL